jgi:hypothetical protein
VNRAQHYVPQLYLKFFVDPHLKRQGKSQLWVYEKGQVPRPAAPKEVAHQRDFYVFQTQDGRQDIVDEYFQRLESPANEANLRKLATSGLVSKTEKDSLAKFIATLAARVPFARTLLDDTAGELAMKKLEQILFDPHAFRKRFEGMNLRLESEMDPEQVRINLLNGARFQQANPFVNLQMMLDLAQTNYESLMQMAWQVWQTDDLLFVTSDNPVVSLVRTRSNLANLGVNVQDRNAEIVFTLSPTACLRASRFTSDGSADVSRAIVRTVNKVIMGLADRWLFASEKSIRIATVFDRLGGTGYAQEDFYTPTSDILKLNG